METVGASPHYYTMNEIMNTLYRNVGVNIRVQRLRAGMTLEDLSHTSGLHASYIGQVERNQKKPSLGSLKTMADALGIDMSVLVASPALKHDQDRAKNIEMILRSTSRSHRSLLTKVLSVLSKELKRLT